MADTFCQAPIHMTSSIFYRSNYVTTLSKWCLDDVEITDIILNVSCNGYRFMTSGNSVADNYLFYKLKVINKVS